MWVDLNKKNSDKIIGFISKNKVPQKFDNLAPKPDQCLVLLLRENMVEKRIQPSGEDRMVGPVFGRVQQEDGCCMSRANFRPKGKLTQQIRIILV